MYQRAVTSSGGGSGTKVDVGTIPYGTGWTGSGTTGRYKVTCGFKPSKIVWYVANMAAQTQYMWLNNVYDGDISTGYYQGANGNSANRRVEVGKTSNPDWLNLVSVDNDGFTLGYYDYRNWSNLVCGYIAVE